MQHKWFNMILTIVGLYATCVYNAVPICAQSFEFGGKRKKETIKFTQVKNLIIIPVYINEKGPYNFLLDTGVGQMIITDTTFAKDLSLVNSRTVKVQGYGLGEGIEALLTRNIKARVGHAVINNIPTAVFKNDVFNLSSYLGIKIHGILGYYFFNSFIVRVNYVGQQISFYQHGSVIKHKGIALPMKIVNAKPYIHAVVNMPNLINTNINLLVDNGSSHSLMMESIDNKPIPLPRHTIPANLGVGINGEIKGAMGRVDSLKIHDLKFAAMLAGFPEFSEERNLNDGIQRNGTLGAEILRHFLVTFDYLHELLYLKRRSPYQRKTEHDMSGMEIYIDNETVAEKKQAVEGYYVGRIEKGSPAELSGIQAGDQLRSIDFRSISTYSLNDLTELLKERDGKQLIIELQRKKEMVIVILRLKRRI